MQVVGKINKVHDDTKPKKLEIGQVARYQLLNGNPNPNPDARKTVPVVYPSITQIPTRDRIFDPNSKEYVDIAVVENYDLKDGVITPKVFYVKGTEYGIFACTGGNYEDEELYEFLELSNYNQSNKNRNAAVEPRYKRIDEIGDSKVRSKKRSALKEALTYAGNLTNGEVKDFAASMNWNESEPIEILRDKIEDFAEKTPEEFVKHVEDKDKEVKTIIKKALTAGVILYNAAEHKIVLSGNKHTLIKMDRVDGVDHLTQAAEYVMHNANGGKVFATIKKLLAQPSNEAE